MVNFIIYIFVLSLIVFVQDLKANSVSIYEPHPMFTEGQNDGSKSTEAVTDSLLSLNRLSQHEGTTIFIDYIRGNHLDGALDVDYSFKYRLSDINPDKDDWDYNGFVTFNGAFDFYAGTRASGPVEGRRYNIGYQGTFSFPAPTFANILELRFSLEHESNGQPTPSDDIDRKPDTINAITVLDNLTAVNFARESKRKGNEDIDESYYREMATETVSRGYDFITIGSAHIFSFDNDTDVPTCNKKLSCFFVVTKLRQHVTKAEDHVFWDEDYLDAELYDYQGTNISIYSRFNSFQIGNKWLGLGGVHAVSASIETGELSSGNAFKNVTYDVSYMTDLQFLSANIPVIISYHNGYLEELYNYHEYDNYLRIGLHMTF